MKNLVKFLLEAGKLKSIERSGWVREGMPSPETVAEHSWRVALLAMILGDELGVDKNKLIKMALIHDLEEAETHDPVVQRGANQVGNHQRDEEELILKRMISETIGADEVFTLWEEQAVENSSGATKEAIILYELGKIATAWQALEYELAGADPKKLDEFWENAHTHIKEPKILELLNELEKLRRKEK